MISKFEQRAEQDRRAGLRLGILLSMVGLGIIAAILAFLWQGTSAPTVYWRVAAGVAFLLLLIFRFLIRRKGQSGPKADPQSVLNLHDDSVPGGGEKRE